MEFQQRGKWDNAEASGEKGEGKQGKTVIYIPGPPCMSLQE